MRKITILFASFLMFGLFARLSLAQSAEEITGESAAFCVGYGNVVFLRYILPFLGVSLFFFGFFLVVRKLYQIKRGAPAQERQGADTSAAGNLFPKIFSFLLLLFAFLSPLPPLVYGILPYHERLREYHKIIAQKKYQVTEGKVQVLSMGSSGKGCKHSDSILIGDQKFEIAPNAAPAYSITIANGGILQNDVPVKVWHNHHKILLIDIVR